MCGYKCLMLVNFSVKIQSVLLIESNLDGVLETAWPVIRVNLINPKFSMRSTTQLHNLLKNYVKTLANHTEGIWNGRSIDSFRCYRGLPHMTSFSRKHWGMYWMLCNAAKFVSRFNLNVFKKTAITTLLRIRDIFGNGIAYLYLS